MKNSSIDHVAICVDDLDQSISFYLRLGLKLSYKTSEMAYLYCGSQGLALMRTGSKEARPHFGFTCNSFEEVKQRYRQLKFQGTALTPITVLANAAMFYAQDPAGNWFEFLYEYQLPKQMK